MIVSLTNEYATMIFLLQTFFYANMKYICGSSKALHKYWTHEIQEARSNVNVIDDSI